VALGRKRESRPEVHWLVADLLRKHLAAIKLSQNKFAERIEMDRSELSNKLSGTRPITLEDVEAFANGLGFNVAEFLAGPTPVSRPTIRRIRDSIGRQSTEWMHWLDQVERSQPAAGAGKVVHLTRRMPIVGDIAAGTPMLAEENFDGEVVFDAERHFLLRVRGDSMIDAGIHDGDLVHVLKTDDYRDGDVVAARVAGSDEATVKYFSLVATGRILLSPANARRGLTPEEFNAEDVVIEGKVLGAYRTVQPKPRRQLRRVAEKRDEGK